MTLPFLPWMTAIPAGIGGLWLALVAVLSFSQRRLLYRPCLSPPGSRPEWMEDARQGDVLLGWWTPPPDSSAPVLVFFHGNSGTLARVSAKMAPWRDLGIGLFAATYRGFEGNPGQPSEHGLYADGRAVLDWLERRGIGAGRVVLYGESLGTGVAVHLAGERPFRALALEAPFAGIADLALGRYPWAPVRLLLRDRYDNEAKIGGLDLPILILHGDADRTVPPDHARRLKAVAPRARLAMIPKAGHVDLFEHGAGRPLLEFLEAACGQKRGGPGGGVQGNR